MSDTPTTNVRPVSRDDVPQQFETLTTALRARLAEPGSDFRRLGGFIQAVDKLADRYHEGLGAHPKKGEGASP